MKMRQLALIPLLALPLFLNAQKIDENKLDEYTNSTIVSTGYEQIGMANMAYVYQKARKVNERFSLYIRAFESGIVTNEDPLLIKLENKQVLKLYSPQPITYSCYGCAAIGIMGSEAQGIEVQYVITKEQIDTLRSSTINGIRMYFNKGYVEMNIMEAKSLKIIKSLEMVAAGKK